MYPGVVETPWRTSLEPISQCTVFALPDVSDPSFDFLVACVVHSAMFTLAASDTAPFHIAMDSLAATGSQCVSDQRFDLASMRDSVACEDVVSTHVKSIAISIALGTSSCICVT